MNLIEELEKLKRNWQNKYGVYSEISNALEDTIAIVKKHEAEKKAKVKSLRAQIAEQVRKNKEANHGPSRKGA